jgi:hypothetical protein
LGQNDGTTMERWAIWVVPACGPMRVTDVVHPVGEGVKEEVDVIDPASKG